MIAAAKLQEIEDALGISYQVGCAPNLKQFDNGEIDLVVAIFERSLLTIASLCFKYKILLFSDE